MWLYVPNIDQSACAAASEGSTLASDWLSPISERFTEACVSWRGKQQLAPAWSRRWKQGGFIRLLSGPTWPLSTLSRGVAALISSLPEIHASQILWPAKEQAAPTSDSLSTKCCASFPAAGLILSSAKTCRGTRTDSSTHWSQHWKQWAAALRQEYSARRKPEIPSGASDCSSWRAESAYDWMSPNVPNGGRSTAHAEKIGSTMYHNGKKVQMRLESQASDWMAPRVQRGSYTRDRGNPEQPRATLEGQAKDWPAPAARDHKGVNSIEHVETNGTGRKHLDQLPNFVKHCLPSSFPDQRTIADGALSSTDSPNTNQPSVKRKLNPIFVEALMRWPTGLSGFERSETGLIQWQQRMLSFLCALGCSLTAQDNPDRQQGSLFE